MTELGLARASDALAAGVDYAGIYNWSTFLSSVGEPIDGDDANRRAVESSPIATIDQWHSPVLLVKADGDLDVPSQQATALIEDLRSHNIDHDVIMISNEIHVMARYSSWMILFNAADGTSIGISTSGARPLRKQVHYCGFDRRCVGPSLSQVQS
jgi:dipeptidyl aminopeptidase/acylaminoacyl peptidase